MTELFRFTTNQTLTEGGPAHGLQGGLGVVSVLCFLLCTEMNHCSLRERL
jgi:hypothetical protein